ncbi:MAG TPA: outer membrane beta-barrel protein [Gammaproteobacteria bacterium]|nr:outer membrane beta-barrel protein [Gammaproteobacteria bacterium]
MIGFRREVVLAVVLMFVYIWATSAYAFNQAGQWVAGLGGGYAYFSSKHHIENTGAADAQLGYNLTNRWGVQGLIAFFNSNSRRASNYSEDVRGNFYAFDVVYHASPWHQFQPYLAAGPAVVGLNPNGNDANNEGAVNGAVGTEWFFAKRMAFSAEVRDFYVIVGGKNEVFPNAAVVFLF